MGNVTSVAGLGDDSRILQISAPVQPGNSGGPLLDKFGNVVGIIVSKFNALRLAQVTQDVPQNINFAIKASIAANFLEVNNVSMQARAGNEPLEPTEIAETPLWRVDRARAQSSGPKRYRALRRMAARFCSRLTRS